MLNHEWPVSDLLGLSTINVGLISGGVAANVIPATADAQVAIRIAADPESVVDTITKIADERQCLSIKERTATVH
jgi:acetylornithine deacetylase